MNVGLVVFVLAVLLLILAVGIWYDRRHRGQTRNSAEMSASADQARDAAARSMDDRQRHGGSFGGSL
jgi:Flp pilus assembly protein TadB